MGRSKGLNPNGLYESGLDVVMIRRILFRPDTPNYPDGSLMSIATKPWGKVKPCHAVLDNSTAERYFNQHDKLK
jgi:hypothetical protein